MLYILNKSKNTYEIVKTVDFCLDMDYNKNILL